MGVPRGSSPPWLSGVAAPAYPPLEENLDVDVAVVGGGVTGLTGAYLAARAGKSVAVLERDSIAGGETGRTTGFLTAILDARLGDLIAVHGEAAARTAWRGGEQALAVIESNVRADSIACDFRRVPAYLYGTRAKDPAMLRGEARWMQEFGAAVAAVDPGAIPFASRAVLRIAQQGRLHPRKYMLALAKGILARGGRVFEGTNVTGLERGSDRQGRAAVRTDRPGVRVLATDVLLSNNAPFVDEGRLYARVRACRTYAMAAPVPKGTVPEGLLWNTLDPYDYARLDVGRAKDQLIFGGADHPVGEVGGPARSEAQVARGWSKTLGPAPEHADHWSGEVLNSEDGLPFIGANPGSPVRELVASGFGGNGLTFGTLAGWIFCERVLGRSTPYDAVFDPARPRASTAGTGLAEPRGRRPGRRTRTVRSPWELAVGEGAWWRTEGGVRAGVYRGAPDSFLATDSQCTHLGCSVEWNSVERSWDCPCHGSRFGVDGRVLDGPAGRPLTKLEIPPRVAAARTTRLTSTARTTRRKRAKPR